MAAYRIVSLFLTVALCFLTPGATTAGLDDGRAAYGRDDYETAFREFMPLAVAGEPWAQAMIGVMHESGLGVPQDSTKAAHWYRRSAEQGFTASQFRLGVLYTTGKGVPQDYDEALRWYRLAAGYGHADAQVALGEMYFQGEGVVQDYTEAEKWARMAAEQGNASGQILLGIMYQLGTGLPHDPIAAHMWLNLGIAGLPPGDSRNAAVQLRAAAAEELTNAQLARAQEMARNWQPRVTARSESGVRAYGDVERSETPRTQRQIGPNPFRAALELRERRYRETQQLLAALGYDPGPVDGVIGSRTQAAVRAFQAEAGLPVDGEISDELYAALTDAVSGGQIVAARPAPTEPRLDSTGTGFAVSQGGHLLTNHHVVADCIEVRVQPQGKEAAAAIIVAHDPNNDLALLEAPVSMPVSAYLDDGGIRAGDSVVAVGFPLPGLLASEANVTTGTVSALAGIGNDARLLQVTVPVQPGNSGGPLLDLHGRVVGVVVGKLDAVEIASVTGDIPQNVNFAIKAGVAQSFLQASGLVRLDEAYGDEPQELRAAAVGAKAKEFTVLVECWK